MSDLWWEVYKKAREGLVERVTCKQRYKRGDGDTTRISERRASRQSEMYIQRPWGTADVFKPQQGDQCGWRLVREAMGAQMPLDLVGYYVDCVFDSKKGHGGV